MKPEFLQVLKDRFDQNMHRHESIGWEEVRSGLAKQPNKLKTLELMENSGGEPDAIGRRPSGEIIYCDCSDESPSGRRSLCYDQQALDSRKEHKPKGSAVSLAREIGACLLTESDYELLQAVGPFDTKTSSWLATPDEIRSLGGALFGDFRYGRTFVYHNGAQSYYASRGVRFLVEI